MAEIKPGFWHRLSPRARRWGVGMVAAFLAYTLIGFLVLPAVLKWQLVKQLAPVTKRQVAVRQVKFNPWALSLTLRGLELTEPDGRRFAGWEEFYVNFQASSLFRWQWTFDEIRLVQPFGEVIMFRDGRMNFANMFEPDPNAPPPPPPVARTPAGPARPPRIGIDHLLITNGFVAFEDQTLRNPFRTEYRPMNLQLRRFTTRPDADTPYSFEAEGDSGRRLAWEGNVTVEPLRSAGHLEISGISLSRFQPYLEDFTRAQMTNGLVDLEMAYRFEVGTNGTDLVVTNLTVRGRTFALNDPNNQETVVSLTGLDVEEAGLNLRERTARLGAVTVSEGNVLVRRAKDGQLNLLALLNRPAGSTNAPPPPAPAATNQTAVATATPPAAPWTFEVGTFRLEKTRLVFEDQSLRSPFKTELSPIEIGLTNLTTKADRDAAFGFRLSTDAAETIAGDGTLSINPVRSIGTVTLSAAEIPRYLPYAEDAFRGRITAGKLEVAVPYHLALTTNALLAGVSNLAVRLSGLEVKAPGGDETVFQLKELAVENVQAELAGQQAQIGRVKSAGARALVRRLKDGSWNLLSLVAAPTNAAPATAVPPGASATGGGAPSWKLRLDEVDVQDYAVQFEDLQPANPAKFLVDQFALNVRGFTTDGNPPLATRLGLRFNETATLSTEGTVKANPPAGDLAVGVSSLDLRTFQPYLEQHVSLNLARGGFGTTNRVRFEVAGTDGLRLAFNGDLWLTNFVTTELASTNELVRWDDFRLSGLDVTLQPNALKLDELKWAGLQANLVLRTNGQVNFATLRANAPANEPTAAPAPAPAPAPAAGASAAFPVEIGAFVLDNAAIVFTDQSIQPNASLSLGALTGSIKRISSAPDAVAEVDLAGKVDEKAPFSIKGRLNPLGPQRFVDLEITNQNVPLAAFTPYTEKYLGHPLNRGRLSLDLKYKIQGTQLDAQNRVEIEQLMLGPKNQSPDATSLPVKLGVALLKDLNGRIDLSVPVNGDLADPTFSLGGAVAKVIGNLIIKAAASPFTLLGSLVGGGGEELSYLQFEPGTTNLLQGELLKLDKLSKALTQRPALNLEIEGQADPARDRDALALARLEQQLRARYTESLAGKSRGPVPDPGAPLDPDVHQDLLRAAFVETFGTNLTAILQTNVLQAALSNRVAAASTHGAPSAELAGEPKKRKGFLGLGLFGGGSGVKRSAAEKQLSKSAREALETLTPEAMEALLMGKIEISGDELRDLMSRRAHSVRDQLLATGAVTEDRLFLVTPKPTATGTAGGTRASLALN